MVKTIIYSAFMLLGFYACRSEAQLETVKDVDINRYLGKWYEIARLPNRFEKDLTCVSATYSLKENGKINVLNQGHESQEPSKIKSATGTAWIPDINEPGKLKVSFFWPFAGKYWIIALDKEYQFSLVGDPSREYLWILSRTKSMKNSDYEQLIDIAKQKGFDTSRLIHVDQLCE